MNQKQIEQMFEGRWRIKGKYIEDGIILYDSQKVVADAIKSLCRDFFEAGITLGNDDYSILRENPIPTGREIMTVEEATNGQEGRVKFSKRAYWSRDENGNEREIEYTDNIKDILTCENVIEQAGVELCKIQKWLSNHEPEKTNSLWFKTMPIYMPIVVGGITYAASPLVVGDNND